MESKPQEKTMRAPLRAAAAQVRVDHLAHPGRFAAQVDVVHAGFGAGGQQLVAVQLVRPHRAEHQPRALYQPSQRGGRSGVGHHQRRVGRRADFLAHRCQLVRIAPAHRPADALGIAAVGVACRHVLGHQPPGEAGGAVDDEVEVLGHGVPPELGAAGAAGAEHEFCAQPRRPGCGADARPSGGGPVPVEALQRPHRARHAVGWGRPRPRGCLRRRGTRPPARPRAAQRLPIRPTGW